jgi:hypothetical protein
VSAGDASGHALHALLLFLVGIQPSCSILLSAAIRPAGSSPFGDHLLVGAAPFAAFRVAAPGERRSIRGGSCIRRPFGVAAWGGAHADVIKNGMTPTAAVDKAFRRMEAIFAKFTFE